MAKFLEKPQWKSGEEVANFLDGYFRSHGWQIRPTTRHEERDLCLGDRHFYWREYSQWWVEYKSGIQTFYTGNVFLETISVDTQNKPGWVYTSQADILLYAAILNRKILLLKPRMLREKLNSLKSQFREAATNKQQNEGYNTHGLLVPLAYAEQFLATYIYHLSDKDLL